MTDLERDLQGARAAHARLAAQLTGVDALTEAQALQPSLLPGWTVGHVLTHLARNADGFRVMVEGAGRGEVAAMYPGGFEQRTADIDAGANRSAADLLADVLAANAALEASWDALGAEAWQQGSGATVVGPLPMREVPLRRWREVTVHHADLGLGYTWSDWPSDYVRIDLGRMTNQWAGRQPLGMTALPPEALRVPDAQRLAWLLGRTTIAGLEPAGLT